jgi:hypothetical protein
VRRSGLGVSDGVRQDKENGMFKSLYCSLICLTYYLQMDHHSTVSGFDYFVLGCGNVSNQDAGLALIHATSGASTVSDLMFRVRNVHVADGYYLQ